MGKIRRVTSNISSSVSRFESLGKRPAVTVVGLGDNVTLLVLDATSLSDIIDTDSTVF